MLKCKSFSLVFLPLLLACNEVSFKGSNKSKASNRVAPPVPVELSCSVTEAELIVQGTTSIIVVATQDYSGAVFQQVVLGEQTWDTGLVKAGDAFVAEGLTTNDFTATQAGTYTVNLRLEPEGDVLGSCEFLVKPVDPPVGSDVTCAVSPETVPVGGVADIAVAAVNHTGTLHQTIVFAEERTTAVLEPHAEGYRVVGAENNQMTGAQVGTYTVEIRLADGEEPAATCALTVQEKTEPPPPPICEETVSVGADIAFIIDNSKSHEETDCPGATIISTSSIVLPSGETIRSHQWECQGGQTNREKATLAAFDILAGVRAGEPNNELAKSRVSLISFTPDNDPVGGWQQHGDLWMDAAAEHRETLSANMSFARRPFGTTPYGSAVDAAMEIFPEANDTRSQVAIIISDGLPTDRNPLAVADKAAQLHARGIDVYTVFVTGEKSRQDLRAKHVHMMQHDFEENFRGHWFQGPEGYTFETYIDDLLGTPEKPSLVEKVTAKVDQSCADAPGQTCSRQLVEIEKSEQLVDALKQVIRSQVIQCKDDSQG